METAILVYSHASAAGRVRRDVPLPPNFARIAIHEKEAMHAGYGGRTNHIIGSKAHHHSEWQKGKSGWWAQMRSGGARSWTTSTSAWKYKLADCFPPDRTSLRSGQLLAATSNHSSECSSGTCNGPRCSHAAHLFG